MSDSVNHPAHYNQGRIEVIEFIEDKDLGFHLGNACKYIARAGKKDPAKRVEDLRKAKWYLERQIELWQSTDAGHEPKRPNDMKRPIAIGDVLKTNLDLVFRVESTVLHEGLWEYSGYSHDGQPVYLSEKHIVARGTESGWEAV